MNKLIALLPSVRPQSEDSLHCWQVAGDGHTQVVMQTVRELSPAKLVQTIAVVPAACLSWHQVVLPATVKLHGDARLLPLLQSLLEDALLDEPDQVHIALMPGALPGQPCVVSVCDKAWLAAWLETFERAGIKVDRLVPEIAPDVLGEQGICSGLSHSGWMTTLQQGVPVTLPLHTDTAIWPPATVYYALPATYSDAENVLGRDRLQLADEQSWVQRMLQTQWELMQHGFASNALERMRRKWLAGVRDVLSGPQWRASRIAVVTLAVVCVAGLNVKVWQQQRALAAKQQAIFATVQETFPQLRVVIDAPLQMQRELQALRQTSGVVTATDLEPMAAAAGAALKASGLAVNSVEYNGTELLLRGLAQSHVATVNEHLRGSRYIAEMAGDALRLKVLP